MCTYNITIEDELLERVRPAFKNDDALQHWMTEKMTALLLSYGDKLSTPPCSYSEDETYDIAKQRLQHLEDGTAKLVDGDNFLSQVRTRYGIEA